MIIPVGHRVLVKPNTVKETYGDSNIVVVQDSKLEQAGQIFGTIASIGDQSWLAFRQMNDGKEVNGRPWAQVGDRVAYARYAGKAITDPSTGEDYIILLDDDIVCIITDEAEA